ncbi:hypothetical protein BDV93DRAFT_544460 [Ceratobasidium sp. AG-I]|nr:hypothetical protein BDV93DRAFT_544460 [Ceratobasidium sp. AG-I]
MANSPKSRSRKGANKNGKDVVEDVPEDDAGSNEEGEDEEGYEVEAILDGKWQYDKRGKWSYFVRWKGYSAEDDLWILEDDAAGAEDLINDWHEKSGFPRDGKGKKKPVKKPRASAASTTKDKKRKASSVDEMDVDSPEAEEPPKKTARGRPSKASKASSEPEPEPEVEEAEVDAEEEEIEFASMDEYMTKARWDNIIKEIETVESNGEELIALFVRSDGLKSKCSTSILAERCPQLLITFYETHLKWRPDEE